MEADRSNYWAYNRRSQPFANRLRHNMTRAEVRLWTVLRAGGIMGYPFRRQRPVLQYIVDFWCKNLNLIIEVDGATHDMSGAPERDAKRQERLEKIGFRVIRFSDEEVLDDLDRVVKSISETIREIERVGGVIIPLKDRRRTSP